jgi:hypothetical protein
MGANSSKAMLEANMSGDKLKASLAEANCCKLEVTRYTSVQFTSQNPNLPVQDTGLKMYTEFASKIIQNTLMFKMALQDFPVTMLNHSLLG